MAKNEGQPPKDKLSVYLPQDLAWTMRQVGVARRTGKTDTDHVAAAVAYWVGIEDPEQVAPELVAAFYHGPAEMRAQLQRLLNEYRESKKGAKPRNSKAT